MDIVYKGRTYKNWRGACYASGEPKPRYRGVAHTFIVFLLPVYWYWQLSACRSTQSSIFSIIYLLSISFMHIASVLFHRPNHSLSSYVLMKRIDRLGIFSLCAGSSALPCAALLDRRDTVQYGIAILIITWSGCVVGWVYNMLKKLKDKEEILGLVLFVSVACSMLPFVYPLYTVMHIDEFILLFAAWIFYALGMLTYHFQFTDLVPDLFGYHEVFHCYSILAGCCTSYFSYTIAKRL